MATTLNHRNATHRALASRIVAWARGPTFARDILIVLAIKFLLLIALKFAFFNHPQARNMSLPPAQVAQALLSVPASVQSPLQHRGDNHAR
ncbi:cytochrome oxidase putative small subunit CydP [Paraburkholderia phymatum]|uniref:Uncharacterized protein n=1 Tax=Paraburkholderia phymatum (strain DSM 17167 / CIP 108236 / LMG 21445 / STM815) TaxID=391038 RepID=B2JCC9_PARP8|nr:cytochrome oxidase putative small subunit CydP [Paraburkholderia phymatum]ACC69493.1 conserved hypothetical protein [Paraburkholderia phymatum STM815]